MKTLLTLSLAVALTEAGLTVLAPAPEVAHSGIFPRTRSLLAPPGEVIPLAEAPEELPQGIAFCLRQQPR